MTSKAVIARFSTRTWVLRSGAVAAMASPLQGDAGSTCGAGIFQCLWCMWYEISWYTYHEKRTSQCQ